MKKNRRITKNGSRPEPKADGWRRLREALGIILLALTALIILSLISYHADDTALSTFETAAKVKNYAGSVGAHLADFLIQYLGSMAVITPVFPFYLAIILFIPAGRKPWRHLIRLSGLILATLVLASAMAALFTSRDLIFGNVAPAGGFIGQAGSDFLIRLFGTEGTAVVLTALGLLGVILSTGLSLTRLARISGGALRWVVQAAKRGAGKVALPIPRKIPSIRKIKAPKVEKPELPAGERGPMIKIATPRKADGQMQFSFQTDGKFKLPPLSLLMPPSSGSRNISRDVLLMNSRILEKKLKDFGVQGEVTQVHPGPVITMYEYAPAPGIKVNRIVNLADDLALAMSAYSVRVVAPIPGKSVVGIEIPNTDRELVQLMEILTSDEFKKTSSKLAFSLGKDIFGRPVVGDLVKMPHLLIAGATGSGKSVMLNTIICSILFRATPADVRFLLIDPKMVEMNAYEGIPHLITPVVNNPKKASWALKNVVGIMEERYKLLAERNAKSIVTYNQMVSKAREKSLEKEDPMPYLIVIIDELADLMVMASSDVEDSVMRIAQMARAVGIHLIIATQRPSVNVITGVIKANLPTRISFQVSSKNDSRIILDANGAEQLLGKGDMLYLPPGTSKLMRVHGAYISETEIRKIVDFIKDQAKPEYDEALLKPVEKSEDSFDEEDMDEKYQEAVELARRSGQISISMVQRRLRIGYNRAARIVEMMESEGLIPPADGVKPRRFLPGSRTE